MVRWLVGWLVRWLIGPASQDLPSSLREYRCVDYQMKKDLGHTLNEEAQSKAQAHVQALAQSFDFN